LGIVEVRGLTYSYPNASAPALKDVNFNIGEGEFVLLTGPSGCGKTTFCRCINGLVPHFYNGDMKGEVVVDGLSTLDHEIVELAQKAGLIFQNPDNQIFALTVEKDVAFGLENLGVPKQRMVEEIDRVLSLVGIQQLKERGTHELSGGQKQRLTIAGILAMHPKVIVMDEPTSFLDPLGAKKIFDVLAALNREHGMTIILIEHRMDLAVKYVNRIIIFDEGKVVKDGSPGEIFYSDETRLIGVGIPRVVELSRRLKNRGLNIEGVPLTSEELLARLKPRLSPTERGAERGAIQGLNELAGEYSHSPLVRIEGISFTYPTGVKALSDISLTINSGEYVAIMGENGAGKTTLVKQMNGLLRPQEGKVYVGDVDVSKTSVASIARRVGLVFQNPDDQLFAEDVEEEIGFALRNFGFPVEVVSKRVEWALNLLDLERYRKSSPFILSGGERKRVALASVLAWNPDILVLDEPTIGQDYGQKERLRHFLQQFRAQGKTVIIVTHDVEFVAEGQPRIVLMAGGRIEADGPAKTIMTDFATLERCSVAPPEITRLFTGLLGYGFPGDVLDVDEASDILAGRLREAEE